ncbi:hypothetical protein [Streptomyces sp. H34-S4]|uniref:hypothetical protein n=1 Tax=Streptomyces sp. H34-S4 TaxID=2996463 RepID=UPI00226D58B0|nr:hypothetical protein [Streptomyces sp. H34-S4]MCY0937547.1 hypothetical protein [Streptomyces sp. H34-S4]
MGRGRPGKPHKQNKASRNPQDAIPTADSHAHGDFRVPDDTTHPGSENRRIDNRLLGQIIGTAMDGCTSGQGPLLTLLAEDAATTAHVVELACIAVHQTYDGLPASMTEDDAGGTASPEFTRLARAGLDGANDTMFTQCERMTPTERRHAANTALAAFISIDA